MIPLNPMFEKWSVPIFINLSASCPPFSMICKYLRNLKAKSKYYCRRPVAIIDAFIQAPIKILYCLITPRINWYIFHCNCSSNCILKGELKKVKTHLSLIIIRKPFFGAISQLFLLWIEIIVCQQIFLNIVFLITGSTKTNISLFQKESANTFVLHQKI